MVEELVAVVTFVGNHVFRLVFGQETLCLAEIVFLARSQPQLDRAPLGVDGHVEFAAEFAARTSQRFVGDPFFCLAPAAC